jgi:diguanylate cyclase (GGDEF)-like protein
MYSSLADLDRLLMRLARWQILAIASCGVAIVAAADYATGYEVSVAIFYLGPVALAAWYVGKWPSIAMAVLSCICWFAADIGAGQTYSHWAILVWNTLVRFGFFLVNALLVAALRQSLMLQRQRARTDALTGAVARGAFEEQLEHDLHLARRQQSPLTLVLLDLDNFKNLNDSRGHSVGDQVLRETVRAFKDATRSSDTVARLGGDEFVLVLPDTHRAAAEEVLKKVRSELQQALAPVAPEITCSIGAMIFEDIPHGVEDALRAADVLMYDAKRRGKNRTTFHTVSRRTRQGVLPRAAADGPQARRR